jgi:hypothetical protein
MRNGKQLIMINFDEATSRDFTKDELEKVLKELGVCAKDKKAALQIIAKEHGLPIQQTKQKVIEGC